ncbi:hypothetical protein COB21_04430 [Candidatus Aerophobetes bacterium]|uniref:DUF2905 domain-containing protein n=1 Tax=Aerophobetes bacterium TaxID=2030807 RepID=A0A2A4X1M1_UNCAE|nr:MAG: hypothetical protein COB21_04430 [Candidatus Aerophobetes bacterium]
MGRFILLFFLLTVILGAVFTFDIPFRWVANLPGDFSVYWQGYDVIIPAGSAFVFSLITSIFLFVLGRR